jgi:NADH dehydrogenase FAD-containing subunit
MRDEVGTDLGGMRKIAVSNALDKSDIKIRTKTKCLEIKDNKVMVEQDGKISGIDCDGVVIAVGAKSRPTEDITKACEDRSIPYYIVGDAKQARRALNAIHYAFEVSRIL